MSALIEIIISSVDFLRAELQDAKGGFMGLLTGMALVLVATVFLIGGLALVLSAVYLGLRPHLNAASTALLTALVSFLMAGLLGWIATLKARH